jgi:hypothetical protein
MTRAAATRRTKLLKLVLDAMAVCDSRGLSCIGILDEEEEDYVFLLQRRIYS